MSGVEDEFPLAVRENVWLRMMLEGVTKSGKTDGALAVATSLREALGGSMEIVGVDTENGRMKLYADRYTFRHSIMAGDFRPEAWVAKLDRIEQAFPGCIVILDSVTHEWSGPLGLLEQVDRFGGWKEATPRHQRFTERIASFQGHVIVCVRSKMKYTQEEVDNGQGGKKQSVRKIGVGPEQRDNFPYDFDLVGSVDQESHLTSFESRDGVLMGTPVDLRDPEVGATIAKWLGEGVPIEPPEEATEESIAELTASLLAEGHKQELIDERFGVARRQNRGRLHPDYVSEQLAKSKERIAAKAAAGAPAEPTAAAAEEAAATS